MDFIIKQGRSTLDSYIHDMVVLEPENHYFVGHFCSLKQANALFWSGIKLLELKALVNKFC